MRASLLRTAVALLLLAAKASASWRSVLSGSSGRGGGAASQATLADREESAGKRVPGECVEAMRQRRKAAWRSFDEAREGAHTACSSLGTPLLQTPNRLESHRKLMHSSSLRHMVSSELQIGAVRCRRKR